MKNLLIIALILGGLAAGCGRDHATAPRSQDASWELVRFHSAGEGTPTGFLDLSVQSNGELTLLSGRGDAASSRGLLAGERLETLARLVDALPPHSYSPTTPCQTDAFFISVTRGGAVYTYASGACDPSQPETLSSLETEMRKLTADIGANRVRIVGSKVLARGVQSGIQVPTRVLLRDRDALINLLRKHSPDSPVSLPNVDFRNQIIIGEFLGARPTNGFEIDALGAEINASGMLRVLFQEVQPATGCALLDAVSAPFVLVAVDYRGEDLLFETEQLQLCPSPGAGKIE